MLIGNTFVFFQFQGKEHIDESTRRIVFIVLISVAIVGVLFFCILRRVHSAATDNDANDRELGYQSKTNGIVGAFVKAIRLFFTRDMLLLCITFLYTGTVYTARDFANFTNVSYHFKFHWHLSLFLHFGTVFFFSFRIGFELSFYSGVYSPSIGFTLRLGESAKQLVGLSGICIGIGEISGGVLFGLLGSRTIKYGRDPIVIGGFIVHLLSFLLIYLNLPNDAPC